MKYFGLVLSGLRRRPARSILNVLAIAVAYVLFGVMQGVILGFDGAIEVMSDTRLRVTSRANIFEPLPMAHGARIAQVPGITRVAPATLHGFSYQDTNSISGAAVDFDAMFDVFPEIKVPTAQREALRQTRTGALVGADVAARYGWKIGDRLPFQSFFWEREEGGRDWFFDVVAIANAGADDDKIYAVDVYVSYEYLDAARAADKGSVHTFVASIEDPGAADALSQSIDALFANSSDETVTMNEKQYMSAQISQVGDIELFVQAVLAAVLFALLFLTGTTMAQSVRDRTREFGVLLAVGFPVRTILGIVFTEALILYLVAAGVGLGIAASVFPTLFQTLGLAAVPLGFDVVIMGFASAVLIAFAVAGWPAWQVGRLSVIDALR